MSNRVELVLFPLLFLLHADVARPKHNHNKKHTAHGKLKLAQFFVFACGSSTTFIAACRTTWPTYWRRRLGLPLGEWAWGGLALMLEHLIVDGEGLIHFTSRGSEVSEMATAAWFRITFSFYH